MTDKSSDEIPDSERRVALSALLLDSPDAAAGEVPDDGELWDWIHGEISQTRAREIEQHVARSDAVYERWRLMRMHIDEVASEQSQPIPRAETSALSRLAKTARQQLQKCREVLTVPTQVQARLIGSTRLRWQKLHTWFAPSAIAGVAILLAIIVLPPVGNSPVNFWEDWSYTKQNSNRPLTSETRDSLRLVLAGIKTTLLENDIAAEDSEGSSIAATAPPCLQNDSCSKLTAGLYALGKTVAAARLQCLSKPFQFPSRLLPAERQREALQQDAAAILRKPVTDWVNADSRQVHCAAVAETINRSLLALHED